MTSIWQARFLDLRLRTPYLIYPRPTVVDEYALLYVIFDYFTSDEYFQENSETPENECRCRFLRHVVGKFVRKYIDNSFSLWELNWSSERTSNRLKDRMNEMINLEVNLWVEILRMLGELHDMRTISDFLIDREHYIFCFGNMLEERKLLTLSWYRSSSQSCATERIKLIQSENRMLETCENPFSYTSEPFTYEAIEKAVLTANENNSFRINLYRPVVKARQKIVSFMKDTKSHGFINGIRQRSGRRKESGSN